MTAATRSSFSLHVVQGAPPRAARMFRSCLIESSRRASRAGRVGAGVGSATGSASALANEASSAARDASVAVFDASGSLAAGSSASTGGKLLLKAFKEMLLAALALGAGTSAWQQTAAVQMHNN